MKKLLSLMLELLMVLSPDACGNSSERLRMLLAMEKLWQRMLSAWHNTLPVL